MSSEILSQVRSLVTLLHLGDVILLAIFACSVLSLGIFLERLWTLRWNAVLPPAVLAKIDTWGKSETFEEARAYCEANGSPLSKILLAAFAGRPQSSAAFSILRERVEERGRQVAQELEGQLEMMGTLASVATLLGLFGTVVGMVDIFDILSNEGAARGPLLARGIATALLTTVFGLAVAIPTLVAFRFTQARYRMVVLRLQRAAHEFCEVLRPVAGL